MRIEAAREPVAGEIMAVESRLPSTWMNPLGGLLLGLPLGGVSYMAAALLTSTLSPRRSEGVREVIDLPWPLYATLPTVLAAIAALTICFSVIPHRFRLYTLIATGIAIGVCSSIGIELLRRDFIGKF